MAALLRLPLLAAPRCHEKALLPLPLLPVSLLLLPPLLPLSLLLPLLLLCRWAHRSRVLPLCRRCCVIPLQNHRRPTALQPLPGLLQGLQDPFRPAPLAPAHDPGFPAAMLPLRPLHLSAAAALLHPLRHPRWQAQLLRASCCYPPSQRQHLACRLAMRQLLKLLSCCWRQALLPLIRSCCRALPPQKHRCYQA